MNLKIQISNFKFQKAFSLIEILIVVFIMSVAFLAFYTVSTVGTKYIIESKNRLAAVALVNEKMEIARNLAYDDIGTVGGFVEGDIPENEDVSANGRSYHVETSVTYVDDSLDGKYPSDAIPNDYKTVKIIVSWTDSNGQNQSVSSLSNFIPPGLESSVGGAPWVINVSESDASGVPQSSVHIVNNDVSPVKNTTIQTDSSGYILVTSAPESLGGYHITVSKSGYETVETMDTTATFSPIYPHASVALGSLNTYNFVQNELSNLTVKTADYQNNSVGSIGFSIGGGKLIGHDYVENPVGSGLFYWVSRFNMASTTDTTGSTSGEKEYAGISPGSYNIEMASNAQYKFIDFDPSASPAVLVPGTSLTYTIRVAPKNVNALFVKITDAAGNPVAGATAKLSDVSGSTEIFSGKISSLRGVIFYPDGATPLVSGNYTLVIEAIGFETETKSITIVDGNITEENIQLTTST